MCHIPSAHLTHEMLCVPMCVCRHTYTCVCVFVWLKFPTCIFLTRCIGQLLQKVLYLHFMDKKTEIRKSRATFLRLNNLWMAEQDSNPDSLSTYLLNTSTFYHLGSILKCSFFSSFVSHECSVSWENNHSSLFVLLLVTYTPPQGHEFS